MLSTLLPAWPQRVRRTARRVLCSRQGGTALFLAVFTSGSLLLRGALLIRTAPEVGWDASLLAAFAWGVLFDLGAGLFAAAPLALLLAALPADWGRRGWQRALTQVAGLLLLYGLLFGAAAEWTFWEEFGARFNFIAVDYLVYTTEVLGNIRESYNLPLLTSGLLGLAVLVGYLLHATGAPAMWLDHAAQPVRRRWRDALVVLALAALAGSALSEARLPAFANNYHRELAKNGLWSLFAAFRSNALDYDRFYRTRPAPEAYAQLQRELVEDGSLLLRPGEIDSLRYVSADGPAHRLNVIQITVESLSAEFLGTYHPGSTLTPNLDRLASSSLVFDRFYATGNRTDRGMEALTLSLPPTPGRSLVKRPANEGLFTLGSVFRREGYDTAFLYGGYGYFDNMNHFFGENGYRVVDRASVGADDITFANAWGACDEDLYRWTLREADADAARGQPFHFFVMTTSNHRPYTYPEGRIDLPPKVSGRDGAVKYTDHAIGEFMRVAATRPWYRDTVFVFVADHCASSAGRAEVPVNNYHIPLLIFSPGGQLPTGHVSTLTSQMDYAPTLLGLLNWSYPSRFFGHDVRRVAGADAHALLGNYQKLGHLENGSFVVLKPQRGISFYHVRLPDGTLSPAPADPLAEEEAVAFYAAAHHAYRAGLYRELTPEEFAAGRARGEQLAAARRTENRGAVAAATP